MVARVRVGHHRRGDRGGTLRAGPRGPDYMAEQDVTVIGNYAGGWVLAEIDAYASGLREQRLHFLGPRHRHTQE
jgi:hypothetical protein